MHFLLKLIPPRQTFAQDMTDAEAKLMADHAAYWTGLLESGSVVVFGLVADPQGAYGIGVVELEDEAGVRALVAQDPTIKANAGFRFDVFPMPRAASRK